MIAPAIAMFLAASALDAAPASAPACAIMMPAACRDTNRLAWASGFEPALRRFLGRRTAAMLGRRQLVSRQAAEVLGGPPDAPQRIGDRYRFTACRAHGCTEKGALVLTPAGTVVAVGILHATCGLPDHGPRCFDDHILSLYLRGRQSAVMADLQKWAHDAVANGYHMPGQPVPRLLRTDVVSVG